MKRTNKQIRKIVSDKIADALDAGTNPWRKPHAIRRNHMTDKLSTEIDQAGQKSLGLTPGWPRSQHTTEYLLTLLKQNMAMLRDEVWEPDFDSCEALSPLSCMGLTLVSLDVINELLNREHRSSDREGDFDDAWCDWEVEYRD